MKAALKSLLKVELFAVAIVVLFVSQFGYAEEAVPVIAIDPPFWLDSVLKFLQTIPYVGPYVVIALKYVGLIGALMTALSTCLTACAMAFEKAALLMGFVSFAKKVKDLYDKVYPWIAYLSVYNVQSPVKLPFNNKQ